MYATRKPNCVVPQTRTPCPSTLSGVGPTSLSFTSPMPSLAANDMAMVAQEPGTVDPRTGKVVEKEYANWTTHPNNPGAVAAE